MTDSSFYVLGPDSYQGTTLVVPAITIGITGALAPAQRDFSPAREALALL
jgi:hypothetical protein